MNIERYLKKRGSDEYDCWELVRDFYQHEYSIHLPKIPIDSSDLLQVTNAFCCPEYRHQFKKINRKINGCVVEMKGKHVQHSNLYKRHVGIFIEPDLILHNVGVVRCLTNQRILVDWNILGYYLHESDCRISQCV